MVFLLEFIFILNYMKYLTKSCINYFANTKLVFVRRPNDLFKITHLKPII